MNDNSGTLNTNSILVNINSIATTKTLIDQKIEEILKTINIVKEKIDDSQKIYDTESATLYRKISLAYIEIVQKYINDNFIPYINLLDKAKDNYQAAYDNISGMIQGRA